MSSRVMSHFSAISSAPRNWLTSCVAVARHPALRAGERVGEARAARRRVIADEIGIMLMFCTPPATIRSCGAAHHGLRGEVHGLLRSSRTGGRSVVPGTSSGSPAASQQVRAMSPACGPMVSTQPKHDVLDRGRVDAGAVDQRRMRVRAEVGRVHLAQPAAPLARPGVRTASRCRPRPWCSSSLGRRSVGRGVGHGDRRIARATRSRCQAASPQAAASAQARFIQRCRSYSTV